jgi:sulfide:quinone oxidoreductase
VLAVAREGRHVTQVLVLGGGFGGLAAATELRATLPADAEVVLVDRRDSFAMGFAKLWELSGQRPLADGTRALPALEDRGIRFVQADVTALEAASGRVETSAGSYSPDGIVVALGTRPAPPHRALLAEAGGHDLYDVDALPAMRGALAAIERGRIVVSVLGGPFKCPPAPYEAALIVDGLLRSRGVRDAVEVVVTTPQPMTLPVAGVDASRYVADHLGAHGIGLRSGVRLAGVDAGQGTVRLAPTPGPGAPGPGAPGPAAAAPVGGEELGVDLLLGVPADAPLPVLAVSDLSGDDGWIRPDPRTLATTHPRVYAVGDCTVIPTATAQLPHAGVFAAAQARIAAVNLAADLGVGSPATFDGHGYCFLELPDERVAFVEGDFYADPPAVTLQPADTEQFRRKQAYEREHLAAWFG